MWQVLSIGEKTYLSESRLGKRSLELVWFHASRPVWSRALPHLSVSLLSESPLILCAAWDQGDRDLDLDRSACEDLMPHSSDSFSMLLLFTSCAAWEKGDEDLNLDRVIAGECGPRPLCLFSSLWPGSLMCGDDRPGWFSFSVFVLLLQTRLVPWLLLFL